MGIAVFVSLNCRTTRTINVLEEEVVDSRAPIFETEVVFVASGLGSKSSSTAEAKQCIVARCREIEHSLLKLLAWTLFAEVQVDADGEVPHC